MINRIIIRIRIFQILFAATIAENKQHRVLENNLLESLKRTYDLYILLLLIFVEIAHIYEEIIEIRKNKLRPTFQDLHPNTRILQNSVIQAISSNKEIEEYLKKRPLSWREHDTFLRHLLDSALVADFYKKYAAQESADLESDKKFLRNLFYHFMDGNDDLLEILEEQSIYWGDESVEIVWSFVMKTIKQMKLDTDNDSLLLPFYSDPEDEDFAKRLLKSVLENSETYKQRISLSIGEDINLMPASTLLVLMTAIAELDTFHSIPATVTINEYINISKAFISDADSTFVNGVLHKIAIESGKLKKTEEISPDLE
jgi:N utilization substance protein B